MPTLEINTTQPWFIVRMLTDHTVGKMGALSASPARIILPACLALLVAGLPAPAQSCARPADAAGYSRYQSWSDMDKATDAKYAPVIRVSGDKGYTGFWFFGAEQFDASNRYAFAMTVYCKDRNVTKDDVADIGYFDLQQGNQWTKIGTTTAWNWQQGCACSGA